MLIYDRFIFIHAPKTAGTSLTEGFRRELGPPVKALETHSGWDTIPPEAAGLPVLMFVRNPWDWYVSWYHFHPGWLGRNSPESFREDPMIRLVFGDGIESNDDGSLRGVVDFATAVRNACTPPDPRNPLVVEMIERAATPEDRQALLEALAAGDDYYTTMVEGLAGAGLGSDQLTIGCFESLLADTERFFARNGIPVDDDVLTRIVTGNAMNATDHRPYRCYYDDELRDLVGRSCRRLVERFDYRF